MLSIRPRIRTRRRFPWPAVMAIVWLPVWTYGAETSSATGENDLRTHSELRTLMLMIKTLMLKVEKLENERGKVTAPFTVVDESGNRIFSVEAAPTPTLVLGSEGQGRAELRMLTNNGAVMNLMDGSGEVRVSLFTEPGQALLSMNGDGSHYNLGKDDAGHDGLSLGFNENIYAALAPGEQGGELRISDSTGTVRTLVSATELSIDSPSGSQAVAIGLSSAIQQPRLTFGGPSGTLLELGVDQTGSASYLTMLDDLTERIILQAGSDTPIRVLDATDKLVFAARDDATGPRLSIGDAVSGTASLELGVGDSGRTSYLSMFDDSSERVSLQAGSKTPISVIDAKDQIVLEVGDDDTGPRLTIGQIAQGSWVGLGLGENRSTSYLSMFDKATERVTLRADASAAALALQDTQEHQYFSVGLPEDTAQATLMLGNDSGAHVRMGVNNSKKGSYTSWINGAGIERASLALDDDGQAGLYITDADKTFVSVRHHPESGSRVAVGNSEGKAVSGLLATESGGRVIVTGPEGGDSVGALFAEGGGGSLSLWDTGSKPRVIAAAAGSGHLTVTGASGSVTLDAADDASPLVEISDSAGTNLVRAGIASGVGVVLTGPGGNGAAGTMGSGQKKASSIEGKRN